ncbi:MAG TPA: FAD-dependent oxidoreductase, partial [Gammaproteobacteria bacterium]
HQMLKLLNIIHVQEKDVFYRMPQHFRLIDYITGETCFELKLPRLPYPLHLITGLLSSPSLSLKEKLLTLWRFDGLLKKDIDQDISVDQWLSQSKLPQIYIRYMLKPLCLAALTTHTHEASARIFQNVLRQTFNGPASYTDLLIPKTDLGQLFPLAAKNYIEQHGGQVITGMKATKLLCSNNKVNTVVIDDKPQSVDHIILATPASVTARLLSPIDVCNDIQHQLNTLEYEPVITVYLHYADNIALPLPMTGLINATAEWLFDRKYCQQTGMIAAVISAGGDHDALDNETLAQSIASELSQLFKLPAPKSSQVIREKRATIRCIPGIDQQRPGIDTPLSNLKLCGDYVHFDDISVAGLPSTLEGALRSGVKCAQKFIQETT